MRREIIQSKTEPNKNNLWLSEEGLKKYGKKGWEPLGGGISPNTPIVDSISGDELVSINVNGENKAVRADELVKGGKEVFILTPDMFEEAATVLENSYPELDFTEDAWSKFKSAVWEHKIIGISMMLFQYISGTAMPLSSVSDNYAFSTYVSRHSMNSYSLTFEIVSDSLDINRYEVFITNRQIVSIKNIMPDGHFIIDETMFTVEIANDPITSFELTNNYKGSLMRATSTNKVIGISNLVLYYLVQSISTSNVNARGTLPSGFSIINLIESAGNYFIGYVYYGIGGILLRIICANGVITIEKETMLHGNGDGTKFLSDDGSYKEVALPPYIWDGTTSETIFEELNEACVAKRRIILVNDDKYIVFSSFRKLVNNLILIGYPESFGITSTTVVEVATYKESDNNKQISSNKYNDISITSDTNITYNENVVPIQIPIFEGQLFFSDTVYNVTFPDDIKWSTDSVLEYKANHTYQFRIVNNLGVMKEFANA